MACQDEVPADGQAQCVIADCGVHVCVSLSHFLGHFGMTRGENQLWISSKHVEWFVCVHRVI